MSRVLVTRPKNQAAGLVRYLRAAGVTVIHVPTVAVVLSDPGELVAALQAYPTPSWVVVTSSNGAKAVASALERMGPLPPGCRVAAVGPTTARSLGRAGIKVDLVPTRFLTSEIAAELGEVAGQRVVLARADAANPQLRRLLTNEGAHVDEVVAYRTLEGPAASRPLIRRALAAAERIDLLTFTSGSTVRGLLSLLPEQDLKRRARLIPAACIGPVTAAEAHRLGFSTPVVSSVHTAPALAQAIVRHLMNMESVA
jgi:uroporphyrinogen-III synthase